MVALSLQRLLKDGPGTNFLFAPVVMKGTAACPSTHGEGLAFDSILSGQSDFTEAICFNNIHSSRGST